MAASFCLLRRPRAAAAELAPARLRTVKPPARAQAVTPNLHFRRRSPSTTEIAIFAGDGTIQNFYAYCQADLDTDSNGNLNGAACSLASPFTDIQGVGGTSVSAEVFAGMVALLNQSTNSAQGLVNSNLYSLAGQSWANCQSGSVQTSACIFNQVSNGTIAMPC